MKRIFTIFAAVLITLSIWAQSPQKMSYQAVIRNSLDQLVTNHAVGMSVSILLGSETGTEVYKEIYNPNPQTNANGLVTIEIGGGIPLTGTFAGIDWSAGSYFIKTETDPTGGTSYTITGTSQLLSVPYALHAKTAESISGTINESDPVYTASQAANITSTDITNLGNLSGVNTGDQDGSETKVTAGTNVTITGSGTNANPYVVNAKTYSVGDFAHGGIVFWVDATGQHGLLCAKEDQSAGVRWYAGTYGNTQAKGDGPFAGEANTAIIIAAQVAIGDDGSTYAARICNELQITEGGKTYGDWYLPSKAELNLMYQNKATIDATAAANGGSAFASAGYWSSGETSSNLAWRQYFLSGDQGDYSKYFAYRVRAVRAF